MLHAFPGTLGKQRVSLNRLASSVSFTSTSVAAGATIGTYGASWTQVLASTPFDATAIRIWNSSATANSGLRGDYVLTVAKGGSGSEQQIIGPLLFGGRNTTSSYTIPIFIPSGTRISLKSAAGVASRAIAFSVDILGGPNRHIGSLPSAWVTYGATVVSGTGAYGTILSPGAGVWSSWVSLGTSSLSHDLWLPMIGIGSITLTNSRRYRMQVALADTTDAATMVTNGTGVFDATMIVGDTQGALGSYNGAGFPYIVSPEDLIYASRPAGAPISVRSFCDSGTGITNALTGAVLAAVK